MADNRDPNFTEQPSEREVIARMLQFCRNIKALLNPDSNSGNATSELLSNLHDYDRVSNSAYKMGATKALYKRIRAGLIDHINSGIWDDSVSKNIGRMEVGLNLEIKRLANDANRAKDAESLKFWRTHLLSSDMNKYAKHNWMGGGKGLANFWLLSYFHDVCEWDETTNCWMYSLESNLDDVRSTPFSMTGPPDPNWTDEPPLSPNEYWAQRLAAEVASGAKDGKAEAGEPDESKNKPGGGRKEG